MPPGKNIPKKQIRMLEKKKFIIKLASVIDPRARLSYLRDELK